MMELQKRISLISEIVRENPGIGKTAIMKFSYLLQKIYKIPTGYEYSIYTYGPYSATVMEDIDIADHMNIIDVKREIYDNGVSGYRITPAEKADEIIAKEKEMLVAYKASIQEMLAIFGSKSAKDLELLTTIIYIYSSYKANDWPLEEVPDNVHEIKPRFDITEIKEEYDKLSDLGIFKKAIA